MENVILFHSTCVNKIKEEIKMHKLDFADKIGKIKSIVIDGKYCGDNCEFKQKNVSRLWRLVRH